MGWVRKNREVKLFKNKARRTTGKYEDTNSTISSPVSRTTEPLIFQGLFPFVTLPYRYQIFWTLGEGLFSLYYQFFLLLFCAFFVGI